MAAKKENKKQLSNERKLKRAVKNATKVEVPEELRNGDLQILMPFVVSSMNSDFSKIQLDVILSIIEKIGMTLRDILDQKKAGIQQLRLFAEEELRDDPHKVKIKIPLKEFGVSQNHYPELRSALKAMVTVPVELPYRSESGRQYKRLTNFCDVYIPEDQVRDQYCIVTMDEEVSVRVRNMELGYHYVRKQLSRAFKSKYSERLYWYIESFKEKGVVTTQTIDLRKLFGLEDKYKDFSVLEKRVLIPAQQELQQFYESGNAPCYFTYKKVYENGRKRGEPEKIEFTIISREPTVDEMLAIQSSKQQEEIKRSLMEDLSLNESVSTRIAKRVTPENFQGLLGKIISLKVLFDDKEKSKGIDSRTIYIVKSLNNFFMEFEAKQKESNAASLDLSKGKSEWDKMMMEYCKTVDPAAVRETISLMTFGGYDPEKKSLIICFPDIDTKTRMDIYGPSFIKAVKKYFGEEVKTQFTIKEKEVTDAE